jgi:hypothetical protein
VFKGFVNGAISFAYASRILARDQALDCILQDRRTILLLACRSRWTFAISGIFSRSLRREALAARLTGSEFRNPVFRSKCGIWKQVFACLCSSAVENEFCSLNEV